ncbi:MULTISPECIES: hypothetical protein [unclassified Undibacterium]|uniref:hypothetical protein n=1 Tax=unclassified Undibacterium TaxID=2630295 RepID=UPI002AC94512|nr:MULTISPECIES: hypothetical protein [unclassified Undibacterium]MEB0140023.1 hypothetical protein [Undibacterium sp. CCC2.1]MEB0173064.1 hypothetical protein [Undibacterium sp. CCC1.1]MEB0176876.1 hypothetical protein [Undibacterium sp. CCC3.4]MEB0216108.1 hypothetical protein [Undibacterium sp. 5I2]WPX42009.1 hypothetical protein RHM61_11365 [Undibacterium sp. CCC3.4]
MFQGVCAFLFNGVTVAIFFCVKNDAEMARKLVFKVRAEVRRNPWRQRRTGRLYLRAARSEASVLAMGLDTFVLFSHQKSD